MSFNIENPKAYNPKREPDEIKLFNNIGKKLEQEYDGLDIEQDIECFILIFADKKVFVQKNKYIEMADNSSVHFEDYLRQIIEENGLKKKGEIAEETIEKAA